MNTLPCATFPSTADLALKRRSHDRGSMTDDLEILRTREENLRQYEGRLRALQAELESTGACAKPLRTVPPFDRPAAQPAPDQESVRAAWDKVYRGRSLLEAEQAQLRDERLALKEAAKALDLREQAVAIREAIVSESERQTAAAAETLENSTVARLTRAPLEMARAVFGMRR